LPSSWSLTLPNHYGGPLNLANNGRPPFLTLEKNKTVSPCPSPVPQMAFPRSRTRRVGPSSPNCSKLDKHVSSIRWISPTTLPALTFGTPRPPRFILSSPVRSTLLVISNPRCVVLLNFPQKITLESGWGQALFPFFFSPST